MELWVNQVLDPTNTELSGNTEPQQVNVAMLKGLARFGLTRTELSGAGLTNEAIDRVYRCLYVYTIGFFDVMQETFQHSEFRLELLSSVWHAFLHIAEAALKVAFKSDYLRVFQAQQLSAAELLVAKEALAEARQDSYNTEKALAWLTAAHAEERALRQKLKDEVETTQGQMVREQRAHQAAVVKFLAEMEARNKLQLDYNRLMDRLNETAVAQANLIAQRDAYKSEHDDMASKCSHVLRDVDDSYEALTLDGELKIPDDLMAEIKVAQAKEERGTGTRLGTLEGKSTAVRIMTLQVYELYRKERREREETQGKLYTTKDALRNSKSEAIEAKAARDAAESAKKGALAEARDAVADSLEMAKELNSAREALAAMTMARNAADEEVARLSRHSQGLDTMLETVVGERENLNATAKRQAEEIAQLNSALANMSQRQTDAEFQRSEISKGFSIAMRSLWANQCGRNHLQAQLKTSKESIASLKGQLDVSNRQIRVLDGELSQITQKKEELTISMECANLEIRRQADTGQRHEKLIEEQTQLITNLQRSLMESQREATELAYNEKRSTKLLEAAEQALTFEKEEVTRLYSSLQELEKQLVQSADERKRLVQKADQIQQETFMIQDKFKRREDTLMLESKRLQSEVKVQKARISSLEISVEASRKKLDEANNVLERKRTKKRKWKRSALEHAQDTANLRAFLVVRDQALNALALTLQPLQVDLAILMADRGREPPKYEIPPGGFKAALKDIQQELGQTPGATLPAQHSSSADDSAANKPQATGPQDSPGAGSTTLSQPQLSPKSVQQTEGEAGVNDTQRAGDAQYASPEAKAAQGAGGGDARAERDQGRTAAIRAAVMPSFSDPPPVQELGIQLEELHDFSPVYRAWDESNQQALNTQLKLDESGKVLAAARKAYERARAIFYTNPTDSRLRDKMEEREADLAKARGTRSEVERDLNEITLKMRKLQESIDEYEKHVAENRMAEVSWRVGVSKLNLRTEHSARLDEAQERCDRLVKMLQEQRTAYDMLRASHNNAEGECGLTEQELKKLSAKLSKLVGEKMELENNLQSARAKINSLQARNGELSAERDQLKVADDSQKFTILGLHQQLQAASQSVASTVKRLEKGFAEERSRMQADAEEERGELEGKVSRLTAEVHDLIRQRTELQNQLRAVLLTMHADLEQTPEPHFLYACRPRPVFMSAEALLPDFSKVSNFAFKDSVVAYIAPNFDMTLVLISHIYMTKIMRDCKAEEFLLGGVVGKRTKLEGVVYDFFMQRFGIRPAAEMHLAAFLTSVSRFRQQHPKIRVFSRLLGLDDPLPNEASEFYSALLNRIHARAGPLVAEAAEGCSQVKCKIIAKACRELLRGSFSVCNEDAANLSDTLRRWAGNNDDQQIDLEVCLEVALKAWCKQHDMDTEALVSQLDVAMESKQITPDDLVTFVKQLDPVREDALDQNLITRIYRIASRQAGPHPAQYEMMQVLATCMLHEGFVGMSSYRGRLEPIRTPPPYDEFRILEEAWSAMRTVVEAQMEVLNEDEDIRLSLPMYIDLAKRLDQQLELRNDPGKAWSMYRTLLTVYMGNRARADKVQPFKPPATNAGMTSSAASGVKFGEQPPPESNPGTASPKDKSRRKMTRRPSFGAVGLKAAERDAELGVEKIKPVLTHGGGLLAPRPSRAASERDATTEPPSTSASPGPPTPSPAQ